MATPNKPDSEISRGVWTTDELDEFHPGPSKLSTFVIPSLGGLQLPAVTTYLATQSLPPTTTISAIHTELDRIHRKVGSMRFSKTGDKPPVVGVTEDGRELYGFFEEGVITLKRRGYRLFKMARRQCEHMDTVQFFLKHFAKRNGLVDLIGDGGDGAPGEEKRDARSRALANRARHRRKKEAVRKERDQMPGQAEQARREELTRMRVERKKVHERIKLGRRRGTLTAEGAKVLQDTYSRKSQINMLEAKKGMIRQGIAVEGGDEIIEDEAEDEEGEGGVRLADGMMGEDDDLGVGNEGCSEDGGSAPEPVRGHRDPPEPVLMD